VEKNGSAEKP